MKLIGLSIDNLRKIRAMELTFNEKGITEIKGGNEQGKSTVLDAVEILLRGKKKITPDMITHGEDKMVIEGVLQSGEDEYVVKRVIKKGKNPTLKITKNGGSFKDKPETFLSNLVDKLTFNEDDFSRKSDDEKLKYMKDFAGIDFKMVDLEIDDIYSERTVVGREVKKFGDVKLPEKVERVSLSDLFEERKKLIEFNDKCGEDHETYKAHVGNLNGLKADYKNIVDEISSLTTQIKELNKQVKPLTDRIAKGDIFIEKLEKNQVEEKDLSPIEEKIQSVETINEQATAYENALADKKAKKEKETEYEELSEKLSDLNKSKQKQLTEAKLPVNGLEIRLDGLFFKGTRCNNWSQSETLDISRDLLKARNPELQAVFFDQGNDFDSKKLKALHKWGIENNMQAILTIVSDIPETREEEDNAYYIVEGELV